MWKFFDFEEAVFFIASGDSIKEALKQGNKEKQTYLVWLLSTMRDRKPRDKTSDHNSSFHRGRSPMISYELPSNLREKICKKIAH